MDDILSPMPLHKVGGNWDTPARAKVRGLFKAGHRPCDIFRMTRIPEPTISRILKENGSRRTRKGRKYKPNKLSNREVRRIIRYLSKNFTTRAQSIAQVRAVCKVEASESTIRRALKRAGYRRCVACPRPFINARQAKQRVAFARRYRWWGTSDEADGDWRLVIWSDECTFETGKRGRVWVTRRVDEKHCTDCIKSVYRSGRKSIMVWGAIGWDWKSPLVFLEKEEGRKGICSKAYLNQVLDSVIFPYWAEMTEDERSKFIFMEDGSKVHKGHARLPKLNSGIRTFEWPPSSPDLNPIEKVWRWMKNKITALPKVPTTIEELKGHIQRLWDEVDPVYFRRYTERLTCKVEDVIRLKGLSTVH